jgi:hypothetical protein
MKLADRAPRALPTAKTKQPEAARALEEAWQRKRQEFAAWRASAGWPPAARTRLKRHTAR